MKASNSIAIAALITTAMSAQAAGTSRLTTLYNFTDSADGFGPYAGMTEVNGIFYGTASSDNLFGGGDIFSFDPATNQFTTLHTFAQQYLFDGMNPSSKLVYVDGSLYGTTQESVDHTIMGYGSVYKYDLATNTETVLYTFDNGPSGASPMSGLTYVNGSLYGTTNGFSDGMQPTTYGSVFKIDPATGAETTLHTFTGNADGGNPYASLTYMKGALYGTTSSGGVAGYGTIFKIDLSTGKQTVLYNFSGGSDAAAPSSGLLYHAGAFYGTSAAGGSAGHGSLFRFDPATRAVTVIYSFLGGTDGAFPFMADLTYLHGSLYGTTNQGGSSKVSGGYGTVYAFDLSTNAETVLARFPGNAGGAHPYSSVTYWNQYLWGTTYGQGIPADYGTLYKIKM